MYSVDFIKQTPHLQFYFDQLKYLEAKELSALSDSAIIEAAYLKNSGFLKDAVKKLLSVYEKQIFFPFKGVFLLKIF